MKNPMEQLGEIPAQPRTVAVIDVGSNAIRMVVAQVSADGQSEVLERTQRSLHLGKDSFTTGLLSRQTITAATAILRDYRRILDTYKVQQVHAVATSAVREARNADAFIDRVAMAAELDVEIIEPSEESRLTVGAVLQALEDSAIARRDALIVDVGGGSAQIALLRKGQVVSSGTYSLGSIRLQETLGLTDEPPERAADILRHHIASTVATIRTALPVKRVKTLIAVGGDARLAARQVGRPYRQNDDSDLSVIDVGAFDEFVERCVRHSVDEISRMLGVPLPDAETLVPALLAYQTLLHETAATQMLVSSVSMRDGLLLDLARQAAGQEDPMLADRVIQSARSIGQKYRYDEAHVMHVADLSARIFDAMQREHGLSPRQGLLLRVAAILHDIGGFVSTRAHHKHSYYLISNSEIFGLRRDEQMVVALTARYHRRSGPKPTHLEFMSLPREQRIVVSKLAAILRVADALDQGRLQQIRDVEFEHTPGELVIYAAGVPDLSLERRALEVKADLFEDVYGLRVRLDESQRQTAHGPS